MTKKSEISQQNFERLLVWLDSDRDKAGQKYETIRFRLIKIFNARGCFTNAEELTDETIDRVIKKIDYLETDYQGNPLLYFYAVGKHVLSESFRKPVLEELPLTLAQEDDFEEDSELLKCLKNCLQTLTKEQQTFILSYYENERQEKIQQRKRLAEEKGTNRQALRTKAFRIRGSLQKCVERCLKKKNM